MAEGSAGVPSRRRAVGPPSAATARRCCGGCGLGRLVRRLRRQGKQVLCAARPAAAALRGCQYDPLSYARNFDQSSGFGGNDDSDAASLYYSYTFSSRFALAASHPPPRPPSVATAAAPTCLASRPAATSH